MTNDDSKVYTVLPGALAVQLLRTVDDPRKFISIGPWKDEQSFAACRATPGFKQFFVTAKELCEEIKPITLKHLLNT